MAKLSVSLVSRARPREHVREVCSVSPSYNTSATKPTFIQSASVDAKHYRRHPGLSPFNLSSGEFGGTVKIVEVGGGTQK